MWINTYIVHAGANNGWHALVKDAHMSFDLEYLGRYHTKYTLSRLSVWGKQGFCDKAGGRASAHWQTLMLRHKADYIAIFKDRSLEVRYLNPSTYDQFKVRLKEFYAKTRLLHAAGQIPGPCFPSSSCPKDSETASLRDKWVVGLDRETLGYFRIHSMPTRVLPQLFVETIGHPLGDRVKAYLGDRRSDFSMPVVVSQDPKSNVHTTVFDTTTRLST